MKKWRIIDMKKKKATGDTGNSNHDGHSSPTDNASSRSSFSVAHLSANNFSLLLTFLAVSSLMVPFSLSISAFSVTIRTLSVLIPVEWPPFFRVAGEVAAILFRCHSERRWWTANG